MKKNQTFSVVSAAISALVLILISSIDFISMQVKLAGVNEGLTAWDIFDGKDDFEGLGIGFLVLVAVIVLIANIVLQFVEIDSITDFAKKYSKTPLPILANNLAAVIGAATLLIVALDSPSRIEDILRKTAMDFYGEYGRTGMQFVDIDVSFAAWLMVILCASMLFVPKYVQEKK